MKTNLFAQIASGSRSIPEKMDRHGVVGVDMILYEQENEDHKKKNDAYRDKLGGI